MSSIINKKSHYTVDSHNKFSIGQYKNKNTKTKNKNFKITFSKKYSYNGDHKSDIIHWIRQYKNKNKKQK